MVTICYIQNKKTFLGVSIVVGPPQKGRSLVPAGPSTWGNQSNRMAMGHNSQCDLAMELQGTPSRGRGGGETGEGRQAAISCFIFAQILSPFLYFLLTGR